MIIMIHYTLLIYYIVLHYPGVRFYTALAVFPAYCSYDRVRFYCGLIVFALRPAVSARILVPQY